MTEYIILKKDPGANPNVWSDISPGATIRASGAKRALSSLDLSDGTYVAVPTRSWKPLPVKVERTTKITIG